MSEPVRFLVLGPLEVWAGERRVALGGRRSRMLAGYLVLRPNESVRRDALIEAIWRDAPPGSASHALDNLVSRVRRELGTDVLQSRPGGYALVVEPECVDAFRFEALAGRGRAALASGDAERAAALLREALDLWRGEPLADLADAPALRDEIGRLLDARAVAVEDRVDADLGLGRHRELVPELGRLAAEEPLRERRRAQLMLALYRSGQQADALRVYREAHAYLADELGLEPGRELRALELAVVNHDPSLAPPTVAQPSVPARRGPARRRGPPRLRLIGALVGILGVTAAAGVAALVAAGGSSDPAALTLRGGGVVVVGKDDVRSVASDVGLSGLASLSGAVWASSYATGRLLRIDPARGTVTQTVAVGQGPGSVVAAGEDLWVVDAVRGRVVRVDGGTGQVVQQVRVGESPVAVAAGFGSVWVAVAGDQRVARLDPHSGRVTARVEVGASPAALSAGAGGVWVAQSEARRLVRIERTEQVDVTVPVGAGPRAVSASSDAVWVANVLDATVSRVDPALGRIVATTSVGGAPVALAADAGGVWVAVRDDEVLLRLTGLGARVARRLPVGGAPVALASAGDGVAVAVRAAATEHRGGTLRVRAFGPVASLDPGACCVIPPEIPAALYDGLTGLDRASAGAPGLVADLAIALPTPTAGGRVYTFTLRSGLRYSNGASVRASDFRRAAERVVRARNEGASTFDHLDGVARRCPPLRPCDLRESIVADDVAGTVSFHLDQPDPDFLYKLAAHVAAPVPAGAPVTPGTAALPGTGPYRVGRFTASREVVLERNRFFREWSPAAQPSGRPDRIAFSIGGNADDATASVLRGSADIVLGPASRAVLARLRTEHPGQLHVHTVPSLDWVWLNTRAAPFDDVRVRRALNLAVDRDAAVEVFGGPGTASATCQALPPGSSGYVRYCPYTRRPTAAGRWHGPDLERARRLVAATQHRGMLVTYWTFNEWPLEPLAHVTMRALRQLGYRTRLRFLSDEHPPPLRPDQLQAAGAGVVLDSPTAGPFLSPLVSTCRGWRPRRPGDLPNPSGFCDRRTVASLAGALRLETIGPDRARRLWAAADRRLVDRAAWVPLVNEVAVDVTGARVGNYAWSPWVGALLDQMWIS